jgi:preprotein translocase subunit YajC
MLHTLLLLAAEGDKAPPPGDPGFMWTLLPVLLLVFYFMVLRPGRRAEQERTDLLKSMKKNDKIITHSGIYGTVVSVSETEDEMIVRVDDNTRLKMLKSVVHRNLTNEENAKAAQDAAKAAKEAAKSDNTAIKTDNTGIKTEKR